jgi:hypothetical protein
MNAVVPDGVIVAAERLHNLPDLVRHLQLGQLHYVPAQGEFLSLILPQCCGSRSVSFWAYRIRIYSVRGTDPAPIIKQK